MNRFAKSGSLLLQVVTWIFALTLFCDAANLDDLFSGTIVLHDDDEVLAPDVISGGGAAELLCQDNAPSGAAHEIRQSAEFPRTPVRIVVDQDSPSLAADGLSIHVEFLRVPENARAGSPDRQPVAGLLHLRFRSLLI